MNQQDIFSIINEVNIASITKTEISVERRNAIVEFILEQCEDSNEHRAMESRYNASKRNLYPVYFVPDYSVKKRMFQGYIPKTKIMEGNYYELEALRILVRFAPADERVQNLLSHTLERLTSTCFGNYCPLGECTAASICVLRFLAEAYPEEQEWIDKLAEPLGERILQLKGRANVQNGIPITYLLLTLCEVNSSKTRTLLERKREWLEQYIGKGPVDEEFESDDYLRINRLIVKRTLEYLNGEM